MSYVQYSSVGERFVFWSARVLSCSILAFWAFFIAAHFVGDEGIASRPLVTSDYVGIGAMLTSLVGLAVAFKREKLGATMTLIGITIGMLLNGQLVLSPYAVIPLAAVLFLVHAYQWPYSTWKVLPRSE